VCHGDRSPAGGFNLLALLREAEPLSQRDRWEQVLRRLRSGEMPPEGVPRPDAAGVRAVTEWITKSYDRLDRDRPPDPGRVTARRLNRFEYANSVKDLLGIDMMPAEDLPPDPYGYGFDNIGDVLSVNASLTERYLKTAERIAQTAIPVDSEPVPAVMHRYLAERIGQDRQLRMRIDHPFPADGEYMLRTAFFQGLPHGTQVRLRIFLDGREVANEVLRIHYQIDRGIEARGLQIAAGRHQVEGTIEVLPEPRYKGIPPYLEYVQVYGPLKVAPAAGTAVYARFFACGHAPGGHAQGCARRILAPLARKAWRRPVTASELDNLLTLAGREERRAGSFELAMRVVLQAILVSPHFLFRVERDRGTGVQPLSQHELATRLSYFLWSSLPDDELARLADDGTLERKLRQQATRMLASPKAAAFVESFAGQWLQLRNLSVTRPDVNRFPKFNGELANDMRQETELFFAEILKEDRPIPEFLDAKFTFLNERLANHYGISGVRGEEFRRVGLDGVQRGGILTQASILTVSSYPTRTSPVIRGKWVLENILNQPPPPPPPDVPTLDEKSVVTAGSMRQQLEKHRSNATCAGCHSRMDPLGFGLENYDAIGRWRSDEDGAVDASGVLPNGSRFTTPAELNAVLKADSDIFVEALAEKLLTYATGRGMEAADRGAVRRLATHARDHGYRFRELILGAVESEPFRMRGGPVQSKDKPR
jgi:hypothetical protein